MRSTKSSQPLSRRPSFRLRRSGSSYGSFDGGGRLHSFSHSSQPNPAMALVANDVLERANGRRATVSTGPVSETNSGSIPSGNSGILSNRYWGREATALSSSQSWGSVYNRLFTSSSEPSTTHTMEFAAEYDIMAKKHGLICLPPHPKPQSLRELESPYRYSSTWLYRKLLGRDQQREARKKALLIRKSSLKNVSGEPKGDHPTAIPLGEFARLAGCSDFSLPAQFAIGRLIIPSSFAATFSFILRNGRECTGVFRIPGSASAVSTICSYYIKQMPEGFAEGEHIDTTICSGRYPQHLSQSVHDVASACKKLLHEVSGGILGSLELFQALDDIRLRVIPSPEMTAARQQRLKAKMIALAILSRDQDYRAALICSLFGLLASIADEHRKAFLDPARCAQQMMDAHNLGVVFGPLLLGDITNRIGTNSNESRSLIAPPSSKTKKKSRKMVKEKESENVFDQSGMALEIARIQRASEIAEMLIEDWSEIVKQLRHITRAAMCIPASRRGCEGSSQNTPTRTSTSKEPLNNGQIRPPNNRSSRLSSRSTNSVFVVEPANHPNLAARITISKRQSAQMAADFLVSSGKSEDATLWLHPDLPGAQPIQSDPIKAPERAPPPPPENIIASKPSIEEINRVETPFSTKAASLRLTRRHSESSKSSPLSRLPSRSSSLRLESPSNSIRVRISGPILHFRDGSISGLALFSVGSQGSEERASEDTEADVMHNASQSKLLELLEEVTNAPRLPQAPRGLELVVQQPLAIKPSASTSPLLSMTQTPPRHLFNALLDKDLIANKTFKTPENHVTGSAKSERVPTKTSFMEAAVKRLSLPPETPSGMSPIKQDIPDVATSDATKIPITRAQTVQSKVPSMPNTTLYSEIRRLQRQLDLKVEECAQSKRELEAMARIKEAGTTAQTVRDLRGELDSWKSRAEDAEKRLALADLDRKRERSGDGNKSLMRSHTVYRYSTSSPVGT